MTKEEYKKNIIRIFDSLRTGHKGDEGCAGIICEKCPFNKKVCNLGNVLFNSFEAIEFVENWVKEHQIVTNSDKFKEVFGTEVLKDACVNGNKQCKECEYFNGYSCDVRKRFWYAEYKPTKEGAGNEL